MNYLRRITESSENSNNIEEDIDDLLAQDPSQWDIFDDYHKFELREQKLKELKRLEAAKEMQIIQEQKQVEVQKVENKQTEADLRALKNKISAQEETLIRKGQKEE